MKNETSVLKKTDVSSAENKDISQDTAAQNNLRKTTNKTIDEGAGPE